MLRVPVISSVGHHGDHTLIDDVAAVACSTPTHAAEAAVPVDCGAARAALHGQAARLHRHGRRAIVERARTLARLSRAPAHHLARHRTWLHQQLRELRASTTRRLAAGERANARDAAALARTRVPDRRRLDTLALALAAHDPQRTLERGYALVESPAGEPVTSAAAAAAHEELSLRLHDGSVRVRPRSGVPSENR
jgi:exodeoxyribonuclease VII large subunit